MVAMDLPAARKAAQRAEADVMAGRPLGLLHGLPIGVKDLERTAGLRTTHGSVLFKDHVPEADQPSIARLRDAGGIVVGKTNVPEFGAGGNTRNEVYGVTGNPFDPGKTCSGSSGGSAVALAAGMVPLATGSDYGGSLRTPAAYCGIVGFRPSPGLIPHVDKAAALTPWGVLGPMGRTVADAHLLLRAQIGVDKRDPYSSDDHIRIPQTLRGADLASMCVAVSADLGCAPVDERIRAIFVERVGRFRGVFRDAQDRDPELGPHVHEIFDILRGLAFVSAHHERLKNTPQQLGPNVTHHTQAGLKRSLADVAWAQVEQGQLMKRFLALFDEVDVLIAPAAAVTPFPHTQWYPGEINGRPLDSYMRWLALSYALTMGFAVSACIPCGVDHLGMPFGIQVAGPCGADAKILEVAHALERHMALDATTARPRPDLARLTRQRAA
jgi:Asp-tRNA(Asn)/Glu-tRNA(Gln) amidotransferase A subunit family amidase